MSYSDEISAMMEAAKIQAIEFALWLSSNNWMGTTKITPTLFVNYVTDEYKTIEELYVGFTIEENNQCPNCGNKEIIALAPNQNKCTDCELTWNVWEQ